MMKKNRLYGGFFLCFRGGVNAVVLIGLVFAKLLMPIVCGYIYLSSIKSGL